MKYFKSVTVVVAMVLYFAVTTSYTQALTISPVTLELNADPGQTITGEIEIYNEQPDTKNLFSTFENFEPSGETGSPKFSGGATGLATWIQTESSISLTPQQKINVPYTISVPADAEPGGYFTAIFWSEDNPAALQAGEVSIGGKLGVLILFRVNGDIKEEAGISNFGFETGSKVRATLPATFSYRFKNDGADRVVPLGDIVIKNIFGGVTASLPANSNEGSVLPNSIRKFQAVWGTPQVDGETRSFFSVVKSQFSSFHFGIYNAQLSLVYGAVNQTALDSFYFLFIPWQLLLVVTLVLIGLRFVLRFYNRWIIAKSKSNQ